MNDKPHFFSPVAQFSVTSMAAADGAFLAATAGTSRYFLGI
jgi:hypothetical protein